MASSSSVASNHPPLMASPSQKSLDLLDIISRQLQHHAVPSAIQFQNPKPDTIISPELSDIRSNHIAPFESDDSEELPAHKSSLTHGDNDENVLALVESALEESPMKRRRKQLKQPKELIQTKAMSQEDMLQWRAMNRGVRIVYESLRCRYHLVYITNPHVRKATKLDRSDMHAFSEMRKLGSQVIQYMRPDDQRILGPIPGVEIGDIFFYRAELSLLGLHGPTQAGIGFAPCSFVKENEPIAISVVASGGYENDREV